MDLYKEILSNILEKEECRVIFPNVEGSFPQLVEMKSYEMLKKIQEIIRNDELGDEDCFMKIEEIICLFEQNGCECGTRHDF